jgi:hypothetical protein
MPKQGAFVLTPVGTREGRYNVQRVEQMQGAVASGKVKVLKGASPRSKATISDIVRNHATGLKRLADR